jgi:hypothetical protein
MWTILRDFLSGLLISLAFGGALLFFLAYPTS